MRKGDRFNAISHLVGVFLAALGTVVLVVPAVARGDFTRSVGFIVYGASLLLAFATSTLFHSFRGKARDVMRRFDRVAIFLLIAGTYTPIMLVRLPAMWGWPLLAMAWAIAIYGSVRELAPSGRKPHSVALYLLMGWMAVLAIKPLIAALTAAGVVYLLAGGVLYTLGGIAVRVALLPRSHEVWHVLALAGSACHFMVMLYYVS